MPSLQAAQAFNAQWAPNYTPVGVFIGGTSGIGEDMVKKFARFTKGRCHIVIVARNKAAAERIFSSILPPTDTTEILMREFVACDASLMKNCRDTAQLLLQKLPKINFLVNSAGYGSLFHIWTSEGLDEQLALRYFQRWRFIYDLLPLLRKAKDAGEDAKVMSLLGAGFKFKVNVDDIPMKHAPGYKVPLHSAVYNDYAMEEFSLRERRIAFTHIYVGFVYTPAAEFKKFYLRWLNPILKYFMASASDAGDWMWYGLLEGEKGFFLRDNHGNNITTKNYEGNPRVRKAIWECSEEVTGANA